MRALEIHPDLGTLRETDDWPWQWTYSHINTLMSGSITVAHAEPQDLSPTKKSIKLFGRVFNGVIVVYPTETEILTDEEFKQFLDLINDHLYFLPPASFSEPDPNLGQSDFTT